MNYHHIIDVIFSISLESHGTDAHALSLTLEIIELVNTNPPFYRRYYDFFSIEYFRYLDAQ